MGAGDWMLVYAEQEVQPVLATAPVLDRDATRTLVRTWSPPSPEERPPRPMPPHDRQRSPELPDALPTAYGNGPLEGIENLTAAAEGAKA